ncbi:MAG TPA: PAS domain S-box protein, partial [Terriglobales bacterium]|nr:PAS domain S-box protein [Terriglobales bacterium]
MDFEPDTQVPVRVERLSGLIRYGGAFLTVVIATGLWYASPLMHRDPFAIFVLAVVFTAHFFGFGPAVMGTGLSVLAIDYFVFAPRFTFALQSSDVARLLIFVFISLLAASLAKQKSRAQVLAEQARERMAAIVASSNDAIYSATLKGVITSWNHGAEQLYGYSANEAIGQHLFLTVPPERTHETRSHLELLGRGENVETYRTQRRRKDGSLVNILLSISPLRDRKGNVIGASAIARDITHEIRAEEALRKSEKLATAGRLTAAIAHEINNPLEAITNLLYLAQRDPARAPQHLEMAEREVHRISDIAQQTLGFVRELSEPRRLSVGTTLEEVLQLYSQKLIGKNIQVQKEFQDARDIYGFPGELRQLFSN